MTHEELRVLDAEVHTKDPDGVLETTEGLL